MQDGFDCTSTIAPYFLPSAPAQSWNLCQCDVSWGWLPTSKASDPKGCRRNGKLGSGAAFLARILQYQETPQYLRRWVITPHSARHNSTAMRFDLLMYIQQSLYWNFCATQGTDPYAQGSEASRLACTSRCASPHESFGMVRLQVLAFQIPQGERRPLECWVSISLALSCI